MIPHILALLISSAAIATADDDEIRHLKESYETRVDFLNADADVKRKSLEESYIAALERLKPALQRSGDVSLVLPLVNEVQAVRDSIDTLPDLPENANAELIRLRGAFVDRLHADRLKLAKDIIDITTRMETALQAREAEFTRAGRIDEALAARNLREATSTSPDVVAARELIASDEAGRNPGDWRSLLREDFQVISESHRRVAVLANATPEYNPLAPFVEALKELKEKPENILMAIPHAIIEFNLRQHATSIRGSTALMHGQGSVRFLIFADGKQVHALTIQDEAKTEAFEVTFPATRKIRIEVDPIDTNDRDWAAWLNPEIR